MRNACLAIAGFLVACAPPGAAAADVTLAAGAAGDASQPAVAENVNALLRLGDLHSAEATAQLDLSKAFDYYRRAAAAGSNEAKLRMAEMLALGQGAPRDIETGLAIVRDLERQGNAGAWTLLGDFYSRPDLGVAAPDLERAYEYYRRASVTGDTSATLRMGEMWARGQGTEQDVEAGRAAVKGLAESGNPFALVSLGGLLVSGDAGPVDVGAATAVLEKAASLGRSEALLRLGDLYSENGPVPADYGKALDYYRRAAAQGDVVGRLRVAEMTIRGQGTKQDLEGGLSALDSIAGTGDANALLLLGNLYAASGSSVVPPDLPKAFGYYRRSADAGNPVAALRAGEMMARGQGTARDTEAGRQMVRRLADAGNPDALIMLGNLYRDPQSLNVDKDRAIAAYEKAASLGQTAALLRLGDFYSDGATVAVDLPKALDYYLQAAAAGDLAGEVAVGAMIARGQGTTRNVKAGREMVREVVATGDANALVVLGDLLSRGDAGPVDAKGAIEAYTKAVALGRSQALLRLGDLYRDGNLVKKNGKRAAEYYRQAADLGDLYGLYSLGQGMTDRVLGRTGSPAEGQKTLLQAQQSGLSEAVRPLADSYIDIQGSRRGTRQALALLETEMLAGNIEAAKHLVGLYRDGRRAGRVMLVKPQPEQARMVLAQISQSLPRGDLLFEDLMFAAASKKKAAYQTILDRIDELAPSDRQALVRTLRSTSPAAYIYLAQSRLRDLGLLRSKATGVLDQQTVRALRSYCRQTGAGDLCRGGPMSSPTADMLSYAF